MRVPGAWVRREAYPLAVPSQSGDEARAASISPKSASGSGWGSGEGAWGGGKN